MNLMMQILDAQVEDINYIDHLRAKESEALGFIPRIRYEMEITGERGGDILIIKESTDIVGFAYVTYGAPLSAKIQQIAIQEDARRMERATALINEIAYRARTKGCAEIGCRCATDLEANTFWRTLGFTKVASGMGKSVYSKGKAKLGKRGRHINIYRKLSGLYAARIIDDKIPQNGCSV